MALNFFVDIMFSQWESLEKKTPLSSIDCDIKMQEMDILEAHILSFFTGAACPWTPREDHACSNHGHGYAGPKVKSAFGPSGPSGRSLSRFL